MHMLLSCDRLNDIPEPHATRTITCTALVHPIPVLGADRLPGVSVARRAYRFYTGCGHRRSSSTLHHAFEKEGEQERRHCLSPSGARG